MEETVIVLMLINKETGILEREIGCYRIFENDNLIYNTYAIEEEDGSVTAHIKLTCGRDVEDWEFSAIYDYYDTEILTSQCRETFEIDDYFNPTWETVFLLEDDVSAVEEKIAAILSIHKRELDEVYEAIAGKEDEYNAL